MPIRFLTAGESHGRGLVCIIEGIPANLELSSEYINRELERRQRGYGRGGRMKIEKDRVQILSGVRFGKTLGGPIALFIENKDWENWKEKMAVEGERPETAVPFTRPRPGHADLAGGIKYNQRDLRNILERASARETACLGSHVHWDRKLDGRIAQAMMSIQAIKGVEIGLGFEAAKRFGSEVHDEIGYREGEGYFRYSNNLGGLEGGITNGMPIIVRCAMKPIPTLTKPLRSVDVLTKEEVRAGKERTDVVAVPAASVVGESALALVLADAFLEKLGGDFMEEIKERYRIYLEHVKSF
jgi:chorismate synthase